MLDFKDVPTAVAALPADIAAALERLPGYPIVLRYVQSSYQNDPVRSAVELILFLFAVRYLLAPSYSTSQSKGYVKFSEEVREIASHAFLTQEIDELIDDWTPEPLVASPTEWDELELEKRPVIIGPAAPKSRLSNGRIVSNLASYNFYNFAVNDAIKESAVQTLKKYGVGACGPRGFYGTQDVHIKTEADVAAHIGTEDCILYSQSFSTISSVIPAFCKRGDIIVADKAVSFAVRKGLQISRSTIKWFEHNDIQHLEKVLQQVVKEQARKPLTRRFIVTEGLFETMGDIPDLPKLVELKSRYKFRLVLDETWSYGVLGRTGAGLTEHQNVDATLVDAIIGSLAGSLCAGGGFCAGSTAIVSHQRLNSMAYTFSAALPAMLATTASETILLLQEQPDHIASLREHTRALRAQLDGRSDWLRATSAPDSPVQMFVLKDEVIDARDLDVEAQTALLQEVVDECIANGVLITRLKAMPLAIGVAAKEHGWQPQPALKVCATTGLSRRELEKAGTVVRHAVTKVLSRRR